MSTTRAGPRSGADRPFSQRARRLLGMMPALVLLGVLTGCGDDDPVEPIHEHDVATLSAQPSALTLAIGAQQTVSTTARCGCGSVVGEVASWASSAPGVAPVDADGTVHAVSFGTATLTATVEGVTATASVVVLPEGVIVGPAGGTVTSPDGDFRIEIPAGALAMETDVVVERVADATFAGEPFYVTGSAWRVRPEALQLQTQARIRIRYDPDGMPDGIDPDRLRLRLRDQDGWGETFQHQHQAQVQRVEGRMASFGVYALLAVPQGRFVGPGGATLTSADGMVELEVPAGAVQAWADVTIDPMDPGAFAGDPLVVPGTAYRLGPEGLQLQERARLRIRYDPDMVPAGLDQDRLRIRERDPVQDRWNATPDNEVHPVQRRIQARIEAFGVYAVLGEPLGTVVGAAGGVVLAGDGALQIVIPPDALDESVDIVATPVDDAEFATIQGFVPGTGWNLQPDGLQFRKEVTVAVRYDPAALPAGANADRLRLRVRDGEHDPLRETARIRLRLREHVVEGEVSHFSQFALVLSQQAGGMVASVVVRPAVVEVEAGSTVQMSAEVRDIYGNLLDVTVTWTSSDPAVATVDENGLVTGIEEGVVTITASAGGAQGSGGVNVGKKKVPVATLAVTPATLTVQVGQTGTLTAEPRDVDGNLLDRSVNWSVADRNVATVDGTGLVTGVAVGATTVTARAEGISASATVNVAPPLSRIEIADPGHEPLEVGLTKQLTATAYDGAGDPVAATFDWSSSDLSMATVDDTGLVTGVGRGMVTITAAVGTVNDAVEIRVVGESEGYGNNLSWPVVFADGVGISGLPVTEDPGIRPTAAEAIEVTELPFWYEGNDPDYDDTWFEQQGFNTWVAEWVDGSTEPAVQATISWGDNLTHQTWSVSRPIRVEQVLTDPARSLLGFNMFLLYGQGPDEMQGTDGTTASFVPTIYTVGPTLTVERISGPGGPVLGTAVSTAVGSEVNVAGKIIYGYNLRLSDWTPPSGVTLNGWYRLSFAIATGANVDLVAVGNTGDELIYVPVVDPQRNISWIDIFIEP